MDFFHALAIIGLAALIALIVWQLRSSFSRREIGGKMTAITVIVTPGGDPGELEQSVKGLVWLVEKGSLGRKTAIVIRNSGINRETEEMSRILERDYPGFIMVE